MFDVADSARRVEQIAGVLNTGAHRLDVAVSLSLQFLMYLAHGTYILVPFRTSRRGVLPLFPYSFGNITRWEGDALRRSLAPTGITKASTFRQIPIAMLRTWMYTLRN